MWLHFETRLLRGTQRTIEDPNVGFADIAFTIGTIRGQYGAHVVEILGINSFTVEITLSKLNAHSFVPLCFDYP